MTDKETHKPDTPATALHASVVSTLDRVAFKPVYYFYYGALFGRSYPGCEWLTRQVAAWEERHGRRDAPMSKDAWEREYGNGDWSFLHEDEEAARYEWLGERIDRLGAHVSVLDVGCGEGVLLQRLRPRELEAYTGVDLSEVAIANAREALPKADFVAAAAERYVPIRQFDVVVFNEIVYYLRDPIGEVKRYLQFVAEEGALLLSVFESTRTRAVLRRLHVELDVVEDEALSDARGTWRMLSLRASRRGGAAQGSQA